MTTNFERETRQRLSVCLARLAAFKPAELAQTDRRRSILRKGLPQFERTLSLFRQVAQSNLLHLAPEDLNIVAENADKTLAQFREIFSFTGEGVENPKQVSASMISAVCDAYPSIYEKLSPLIKAPPSEPEVARNPKRGAALALSLAVVALAGAIIGSRYAGYNYPAYTVLADKVLSTLR